MARLQEKVKKPDTLLLLLTVGFVLLGIVMIATAGIIKAYELFGGGQDYFFFTRQVQWALIGFFLMAIATQVPYTFWKRHALTMLVFGIFLAIAVFIPGISKGEVNGAMRWIQLPGLGVNFQPSELLKLLLPIYLAAWLSQKESADIRNVKYGLLPFLVLVGAIVLVLELQSDLGTIVLIASISLVCFFVAGANLLQLGILMSLAVALGGLLIKLTPYRMNRLTTFLHPFEDPTGTGYHIYQALLALGSGGLFGVGFGHSRQKYLYLPEPVTDSIFPIIGEELGFIGGMTIIVLFLLFGYWAFHVALYARDTFGRLLASSIAFWIPFQAMMNIGAMMSLIPMTGIPLPFVSYGGSSLVVTLFAVGILLNISKYSSYDEEPHILGSLWRGKRGTSFSTRRSRNAFSR